VADSDARGTSSYSPYLLVNNVMRLLATDGYEKISVTTGNSGRAVEAASDLFRALGVIPGWEEP
jgi:hypothetical protein